MVGETVAVFTNNSTAKNRYSLSSVIEPSETLGEMVDAVEFSVLEVAVIAPEVSSVPLEPFSLTERQILPRTGALIEAATLPFKTILAVQVPAANVPL